MSCLPNLDHTIHFLMALRQLRPELNVWLQAISPALSKLEDYGEANRWNLEADLLRALEDYGEANRWNLEADLLLALAHSLGDSHQAALEEAVANAAALRICEAGGMLDALAQT